MHWIIWSWIVKKFYDTIHNEKQREDGRETQHGVLYCNNYTNTLRHVSKAQDAATSADRSVDR